MDVFFMSGNVIDHSFTILHSKQKHVFLNWFVKTHLFNPISHYNIFARNVQKSLPEHLLVNQSYALFFHLKHSTSVPNHYHLNNCNNVKTPQRFGFIFQTLPQPPSFMLSHLWVTLFAFIPILSVVPLNITIKTCI